MAYRVIRHPIRKNLILEFFKVFQRNVIGRRLEAGRRVINRNGGEYHVTKGWR